MLENIGSPPALLVLTDNSQLAGVLQELPLRAWGLLLPDVSEEELSAAIHALHEGLLVNSPVLLQPVLGQMMISREEQLELIEELTARESEVLQLLAQGLANKQIALALGISEHTVKFHISSIYAKLGVTNRTEAVTQGARLGLIVL
jgi:DNA-binding NarL/FixJ family response regulator